MKHLSLLVIGFGLAILSACTPASSLPDIDKLLTWTQNKNANGQLVLFDEAGTTAVVDLPDKNANVAPCGITPTSPDGRVTTFTVSDTNTVKLYQMTNADSNITLLQDQVNLMTCTADNLQYAPNSARVGYLTWDGLTASDIKTSGRLIIRTISDNSVSGTFENVASFDLVDSGAILTNIFTNANGKRVEAGVVVWDGSNTREITTLYADETNRCEYKSASVRAMSSNQFALTLGLKCEKGETSAQYQMYVVDSNANTATLLLQGTTSGNYFDFSRTNNVYTAPNGATLFQTLPDNADNDASRLIYTGVANAAETVLVPKFVVMPQFKQTAVNHVPTVSADGRWLAVVQSDGDNNATLYVFDMNAPTVPPITVSAGSTNDAITDMIFTTDSRQLFYVAGAVEGDNSAFLLDLTTGVSNRLGRGRYAGNGVLSPYSNVVALVDRRVVSDTQPAYDVLVLLDLTSGKQTDLIAGADVADGKVTNIRYLTPIAWRR